ncbi:MAG: 4'-phosphopantetheinyl transferase superfamily protein [Bacteroidota bacterium]
MKTIIRYAYLSEWPADQLIDFFPYLSVKDQEKNRKYYREVNRNQHLMGRMLLADLLQHQGLPGNELIKELNVKQKPHLPNTDICFNISHSEDLVICAICDHEVGIDVERINHSVDFNDFGSTMNATQWQVIHQSDDPPKAFFDFWAAKESLIKADGRGLAIPLEEIEVYSDYGTIDDTRWELTPISLTTDYACCLAGESLGEVSVTKLLP